MKILLTSFGIEKDLFGEQAEDYPFYRMPPVALHRVNSAFFLPEYELLLLADKIVMDGESLERLKSRLSGAYSAVASTYRELEAAGRIEVADFSSILRGHLSHIQLMTDHDLAEIEQWVEPFKQSLAMWESFATKAGRTLSYELHHLIGHGMCDAGVVTGEDSNSNTDLARVAATHEAAHVFIHSQRQISQTSKLVSEALRFSTKRRKKGHREALKKVLESYLKYVNGTLVLSNHLNVAFHDWGDFFPFYNNKFLYLGHADPVEARKREMERLFAIPFPEFAIDDPKTLVKALGDKRIEDLRRLVEDAVNRKVRFDEDFAKSTLKEVLKIEQRSARWKNIVGYLTIPLGFIPGVGFAVDKAAGEAVGRASDRRFRKPYQWFYLLSDLSSR